MLITRSVVEILPQLIGCHLCLYAFDFKKVCYNQNDFEFKKLD